MRAGPDSQLRAGADGANFRRHENLIGSRRRQLDLADGRLIGFDDDSLTRLHEGLGSCGPIPLGIAYEVRAGACPAHSPTRRWQPSLTCAEEDATIGGGRRGLRRPRRLRDQPSGSLWGYPRGVTGRTETSVRPYCADCADRSHLTRSVGPLRPFYVYPKDHCSQSGVRLPGGCLVPGGAGASRLRSVRPTSTLVAPSRSSYPRSLHRTGSLPDRRCPERFSAWRSGLLPRLAARVYLPTARLLGLGRHDASCRPSVVLGCPLWPPRRPWRNGWT